jgi:hypothetical protein
VVQCGTWSKTSVALSQLTQFWQIPRHRTLSYSLSTLCFVTTAPSGEICKYATALSTKKTWRGSLPIDMLLSAMYVLVVVQPSSEFPEGLMNYPVSVDKITLSVFFDMEGLCVRHFNNFILMKTHCVITCTMMWLGIIITASWSRSRLILISCHCFSTLL